MELINLTKNQIIGFFQERLWKNSSNQEIFNTTKCKYEDALKKSGLKVDFKYTKNQQQKPKNRSQNIIWFNSQFKNAVSRNAAEIFLLDISFTNVPLDYTLNLILK